MLLVLTPEEALGLIKEKFSPLPKKEWVSLSRASGRVLVADIIASEYVPGFDRSTVDGYAVLSSDTFGAGESIPAMLSLTGEILMGEEARDTVSSGECIKISTGGMLPEGADSVVMVIDAAKGIEPQTRKLFKEHGINARFAMILTEANQLGRYPKPRLIIADESHLARSKSWMKVLDYYNTFTVGFTATPVRLDGKPLGDMYDTLIEGVSVRWLIDNHRLAPFEYYAPMSVDTGSIRKVAGDYVVSDLERIMTEKAIYSDAIKSYKRLADGEKTIAYCVSVKHAESLAEKFREAGYSAASISASPSSVWSPSSAIRASASCATCASVPAVRKLARVCWVWWTVASRPSSIPSLWILLLLQAARTATCAPSAAPPAR